MEQGRFSFKITILIALALLLATRLVYIFISDTQRFSVRTVQVTASYAHISRQDIEQVLSKYLQSSYWMVPVKKIRKELLDFAWTDSVFVQKIWPYSLKITLKEKKIIASWNNLGLTEHGELLLVDKNEMDNIPVLKSSEIHLTDVLHNFQKLSKLLARCELKIATLQVQENNNWELALTNGVELHLGTRDVENRLRRFCKTYPELLTDKSQRRLCRVDLRYPRGMAVQWKQ